MSERILLTPTLLPIELNEQSNDIYMTLKMIILTSNINLNGAKFTEDFIDGVVENQEHYHGIGLVVNKSKLENEQFDSLSHEFDGESLNTDMIGSFVGFEKVDNGDGSFSLVGESRVLKRFPKTCEAIVQLASENKLRFSCEALVAEYGEVGEGFREIPYAEGKNKLIANCLVTSPAEVNAKPTLLVASLEEDINLTKSDNKDSDLNINNNVTNGGGNVFKFKLEMNADGSTLSYADMRKQMNQHLNRIGKHMSLKRQMMDLNAMDVEAYGQMADMMLSMMPEDAKYFSLWTPEDGMFEGYCVCSDWYNDMLFMMDWSTDNEEVSMSNPRKAKIQYVETSEVVVSSLVKKLGELNSKSEELSSQLESKTKELEDKVTEFNSLVEEKGKLETKVNELSQTRTEEEVKDEAIVKLNSQINELNDKIAQMQPLVEKHLEEQEIKRQQELAEKQDALKQLALSSKLFEDKEFEENEELKNAITELNEQFIKSEIADRAIAKVIASEPKNENGDVSIIINTEGKDLIPQDAKSYMYSSRKTNN